ncbi:MAG TPA: hypothetical protein VFN80_07260 [Acidothermaceae bacterium]|nr:hypothetical protein [Acidothermaceae bacterium]
MSEEDEMLHEVFKAHEYLAPDPVSVRAGIRNRARAYARRRKAAQAAGGAVLGAGLVTVGVAAPYLARNASNHSTTGVAALGVPSSNTASASAASSPTPLPSPVSSEEAQRALDAYFAAGYDYNDAMQLAVLWKMPNDALTVKTAAGEKLLAGETLPIKPSTPPESSASAAEINDTNAFFNAGYTYDDALKLTQLWNLPDAYHAKVSGGQKLIAGQTLPIKPGSTPSSIETASPAGLADSALTAYFNAGYDYSDAMQLAKLWNMTDPSVVKTAAGEKLLAGQTLPIKPSGTPVTPPSAQETAEVDAFFNAGYTYNDAAQLAALWKLADAYHAKILGGQKLLAGQTLPIKP